MLVLSQLPLWVHKLQGLSKSASIQKVVEHVLEFHETRVFVQVHPDQISQV